MRRAPRRASASTTSARGSSSTGLGRGSEAAQPRSFAASAPASRCEPAARKGQPTAWPRVTSASPKPPLGRRSSGSIECPSGREPPRVPAPRRSGSLPAAAPRRAIRAVRSRAVPSPGGASTSSTARGESGSGPSRTRSISCQASASGPTSRRYAASSRPSAAAVASRSRSSRSPEPSSNGCAAGASGCTHSTSRSSSRKNGEPAPSGWIEEQTSWTKPGSVSSADRRPPPSSARPRAPRPQPRPRERDRAREPVRARADDDGLHRNGASAGRAERLAATQHRLEEVAVPLDPFERLAPAEVPRPHLLAELLPAQRRRDRRARLRPHRVGRRDRLAVPVLAVVDEDAAPLLLQPLRRHEARVFRLEPPRHAAPRPRRSPGTSSGA